MRECCGRPRPAASVLASARPRTVIVAVPLACVARVPRSPTSVVCFDSSAVLRAATPPWAWGPVPRCAQGFSCWEVPSESACRVAWNDRQQGLMALVERYRRSPPIAKQAERRMSAD